MSSEAQINANRANSLLSTGPKSEIGKAISSHNAVKTGLTGRTVVLPTEDREIYQNHVHRFFSQYQPATDDEKTLVQSVADSEWRLLRIPSLESGLYAIGRRQFAAEFSEEADPDVRATLIEAHIFSSSRKDLSNLAYQESRLRRMRDADLAALKEMQGKRKETHEKNLNSAAIDRERAAAKGIEYDPSLFGFEFSLKDVSEFEAHRQACRFMKDSPSKFSRADFDRYMQRREEEKAA